MERLDVVLPPIDEQQVILDSMVQHVRHLDAAKDHAHRQIDLIREYRTRLIADLVTGKLDVSGVPLPELESRDDVHAFDDLEEKQVTA